MKLKLFSIKNPLYLIVIVIVTFTVIANKLVADNVALPTAEAAIKKANELGYESIIHPPSAHLVKDYPENPLVVYFLKRQDKKYLYEELGLKPPIGIKRFWIVYYFIGPLDENIAVILDFQTGEVLGVLKNVTIGRRGIY